MRSSLAGTIRFFAVAPFFLSFVPLALAVFADAAFVLEVVEFADVTCFFAPAASLILPAGPDQEGVMSSCTMAWQSLSLPDGRTKRPVSWPLVTALEMRFFAVLLSESMLHCCRVGDDKLSTLFAF